jgi:hypothetical protein
VRRIKAPHLHDPEYAQAARHQKIVEVLQDLWGTVRLDTGKLNMKSAGYGAQIEWHQDWAFIRTPMTTSPRSASCSTIARLRTAR